MEGRSVRSQGSPVRLLVCALPVALTATIGCASVFDTKKVLHASSQGSVALEEVVDWSFEASHPTMVDAAVLARALQGVRISSNSDTSVYAPADISYLAPLLSNALSKATREHVVAFQVTSDWARQNRIAGGTLYVKGPTLYLTPVPTQAAGTRSSFFGGSRAVPAGGAPQDLNFEPRSVARIQKAPSDLAQGHSHLTSFAIDHLALAKLPIPASLPVKVATPASTTPATPGLAPSITVPQSEESAKSIASHTTTPAPTAPISPPAPPAQGKATGPSAKATAERATQPPTSQKASSAKKAASAPKAVLRPAPPKAPEPSNDHSAIIDVLKKGAGPESTQRAQ